MAISNNPLLVGVSGSLGDMITVKQYRGRTILCQKIGEREKKASARQEQNQELFRKANAYAKEVYDDPVKREEARRRLKAPHGNPLYRAILKEYRQLHQSTDTDPKAPHPKIKKAR